MNDPESYQSTNQQQRRDTIFFLDQYSSRINWKMDMNRILDIGCGDGSFTAILKRYIPTDYTLIGVDISEAMVHYASSNHRDERTSFSVLDIGGALPEDLKGSFDHVFSFYVLHWIIDQERAFRNIHELLADGGDCFLTFVANAPVFDVYRILEKNNKWSALIRAIVNCGVSPYNDNPNPEETVRDIMEKVGFTNIDVRCEEKVFIYENMAIAKKALKAICPFNIPANLCDDFMDDYVEAAKKMGAFHTTNDGTETLRIKYGLVVVYSRKLVEHRT